MTAVAVAGEVVAAVVITGAVGSCSARRAYFLQAAVLALQSAIDCCNAYCGRSGNSHACSSYLLQAATVTAVVVAGAILVAVLVVGCNTCCNAFCRVQCSLHPAMLVAMLAAPTHCRVQ